MVSDLIGAQAHTWDKLSSISRSKKIGSAYLFSGPVGSGKEGLALKFAQLINCKSGSSEFCGPKNPIFLPYSLPWSDSMTGYPTTM